jgi:hypothetical protein
MWKPPLQIRRDRIRRRILAKPKRGGSTAIAEKEKALSRR